MVEVQSASSSQLLPQHVFIVGSKGIPGNYGGYETFVDKLTEYHQNERGLKYHVACKAAKNGHFIYHNADCFNVKVPSIGSAQAIYYDVAAIRQCLSYIRKNHVSHPIVYILACRIGPFAPYFYRAIHKLGGELYINPDGHEWMRAKWSAPVRRYWKVSERLMTKHCDLLVCDSKNIEQYIHSEYAKYHPKTMYISYGAEIKEDRKGYNELKLSEWYKEKGLAPRSYYLVVGRFVPENNYETMIREFMKSNSEHDFALICNVSTKFLEELKARTHFDTDPRIKFVGTVYDKELLMGIRENAYGYLHGHEVGGTNPSLLEALGCTDLNLLLDVGFNREVADDAALYWKKEEGSLAGLIERADQMSHDEITELGRKARARIVENYSWQHICNQYKSLFMKNNH